MHQSASFFVQETVKRNNGLIQMHNVVRYQLMSNHCKSYIHIGKYSLHFRCVSNVVKACFQIYGYAKHWLQTQCHEERGVK